MILAQVIRLVKPSRALIAALMMAFSADAFADSISKGLRCLAQNIYFEARGESLHGQLAVALVTMNRVRSPKYPNDVCQVVWQRRQFSWTHDGKSDRPRDMVAWRRALQIAEFVYHKYNKLPEQARKAVDITNGALFYYAPKLAQPYWARHKQVTAKIGGHIFLTIASDS